MAIKTDIILIPYWIFESIKRRGLPLATCLDFNKVSQLLAPNDLYTFAGLQTSAEMMLGNTGISVQAAFGLRDQWSASLGSDKSNETKINSIFNMCYDQSFVSELQGRLFHADTKQDQYEKAVITYDLSPTAVGVVIYPGFFTVVPSLGLQLEFVTAVLNALYVYNEYHEVAGTSWYKRQLQLLSV